jgi:hypothetical protein
MSRKTCYFKKVKTTIFKYQRTCLETVKIDTFSLFKYKNLSKNMSFCLEGL